MKIQFVAKFVTTEGRAISDEKLFDYLLIFAPKVLKVKEQIEGKVGYNRSYLNAIEMEMDYLTLKEIKEKLATMGIRMSDVKDISIELTKEEREELKKGVCLEQIFNPKERLDQ